METSIRASGFPLPDDTQAFVLFSELLRQDAQPPTELAKTLRTGRANISKIVRRLEATGLVDRTPNPADTRSVLVRVSPQGRSFAQKYADLGQGFYARLFRSWEDDEVAEFADQLTRFTRELEALTAVRVASADGRDGTGPTD
ncbi:MarR family winged helix-turn-helix transcriptional regulator [Agromyces sp. NPDC056523]|uniref:MarR family winged helix-turn-helix transcriptional regulator n=1 Tax=Agromyces sp. NPDC056523 TaxID=3345850 RepID=UPI003670229B